LVGLTHPNESGSDSFLLTNQEQLVKYRRRDRSYEEQTKVSFHPIYWNRFNVAHRCRTPQKISPIFFPHAKPPLSNSAELFFPTSVCTRAKRVDKNEAQDHDPSCGIGDNPSASSNGCPGNELALRDPNLIASPPSPWAT